MPGDSRLDAVREYLARGWQPLPIPPLSKAPIIADWTNFRTNGNPEQFFSEPCNVGVLLGETSGGLVDIDLDAPEALGLATRFLPATSAVFGRASKPQSHHLYLVQPTPSTTRFLDVNGASLIELRSVGAQTIFPPSTHPSGEAIEWDQEGEPVHVDWEQLPRAVRRLAAATLLVRHYPAEGSRHEFALALSGALVRGGWTADEIANFLQAVAEAAGDPEVRDRAGASEYSAKRIAGGRPATGWTRLEKLIGRDVTQRLRDWLSLSTEQSLKGTTGESGPYRIENGRIIYEKQTLNGPIPIPLSNFSAKITEEILLDDGRDQSRAFQIEGSLSSGKTLAAVRVPVDKFQAMSWPIESWGNNAVVSAGQGAKDRLREAIQLLSGQVPTRRIFCHTGWTVIDGKPLFLSANGALGVEEIEVDLPPELRRYALPCEVENVREATEISLRLLEVAPLTVTAPLWAGIFRAPLASAYPLDVSLFLHGPTGALKSSIAALFLDHFGNFSRTTLSGTWSSTANALEHRAFVLKDVPFVIDDFAPSPLDAREMETKAARLLRAGGNLSGRGRLRSDLSEHITHPPRSLIISTGEQVPTGQSILARTVLVSVEPGAVSIELLTELQALVPRLPHAMAGYIQWLTPQMEDLPQVLCETFAGTRSRAHKEGTHLRVPEALAHLWLGLDAGLQFAEEVGAVSHERAEELRQRCWVAFLELGGEQTRAIEGERPTRRFLEVLTTLLSQEKACVLPKGETPDEESHADFLGWYDEGSLYLMPNAAVQAVTRFCRQLEEPFSIRRERLFRDLRREGLSECEPGRTTANIRIGQGTRRVLHLRRSAVETMLGETLPVGPVPSVPSFGEGEE